MIGKIIDNREKANRQERYPALEFDGGPQSSKRIVKILKNRFDAKSSLWNSIQLCTAMFVDDYQLRYFIKGKPFDIQNLGFTWMDGLALVTEPENADDFF